MQDDSKGPAQDEQSSSDDETTPSDELGSPARWIITRQSSSDDETTPSDGAASAAAQDQPEPSDASPSTGPKADRRPAWLPVAIIVAAILIGNAAIAAAIFTGFDRLTDDSSTEAQTAIFAGPGCQAWVEARRELEAIAPLPAGLDAANADVEKLLKDQQTAIKPVINMFELKTNELPDSDITPLAKRYIQAQRDKMQRQVDRTASAIDVDLVNAGYTWLNRACGLAP